MGVTSLDLESVPFVPKLHSVSVKFASPMLHVDVSDIQPTDDRVGNGVTPIAVTPF